MDEGDDAHDVDAHDDWVHAHDDDGGGAVA